MPDDNTASVADMAGISDMRSQLKEEKNAHQVMKEQVDNLRTSIPNSKCRAKKALEAHDKKKRNLKVMFQIQKQQLKMFKEFIEEDDKSKSCIDSSVLKRVADIEKAVENIRKDVVAKRHEEKKEDQSSDEVATLQENLKLAEKKISELERIVDAKDKKMMVYEKEFSRHRLETKRYSDEAKTAQVELQETNEIVNEMQGIINDREEEIAKYIDFVTEIAGKVKESNEEACELRQQLAKKEEEMELLQKNISDLEMQVEAKKGPCCTELALRDQQIKALEEKVTKTGEEKLEMDKQIESLLDELAESMSAHAIGMAAKHEEVAQLNMQLTENSESMEVDKPDETSKDENVIGSEWPMKEKQCKMTVSSTEADSARKLSTYDKGDEN